MNIHGKRVIKMLHRAVAEAFINNKYDLPEVNHKDENIANNSIDNLEWCTSKYNANYGNRNRKLSDAMKKKKVKQYSINGTLIKTWDSMANACKETGADISSMIRVCKGKQNTCIGSIWKYE